MTAGARTPLVAANWKMHLVTAGATAFCRALLGAERPADVEVAIFPSYTLLPAVAASLAGSNVGVGGQDLHGDDIGAHTGDVSGIQLRDAGCGWVIVGHSERRRDHGEDDATVAKKLAAAARHGLRAILCLGETRDERRAGATFAVLERQLAAALATAPPSAEDWVVAYEPVWAIGTGDTATPAQAQEAHAFLRGRVGEMFGEKAASALPIQYGGSVKPDNAATLLGQPDVDGALVGGASLKADSFLAIVKAGLACSEPAA